MKRSTLILLVCAAALLGVTLWVTSGGPEGPPASLSVPGYASAEDLEAESRRGLLDSPLEIAHEIDEIVLERPSGAVRLVREGEGTDATWRIAEPVDATAVKYQVDKITGLFKTQTDSGFTTRVKEDELALYDLEPERRIGLTLKSKGAVYQGVDLYVGRVEKSDAPGAGAEAEVDTWVVRKGEPGVVHRVVGKDLRGPADAPLDSLRDKLVFQLAPEDLSEVTIATPEGRRVVLSGARSEPEAVEGAAPKVVVTWSLTEPAGVKADATAQGVARSLAGLRAKEFVPSDAAGEAALAGATWRVEGKTFEGDAVAVVIADGGVDDVWARVEGRSELMKLSGHTANQLRKGIEELEDKVALDVEAAAVTGVVFGGAEGAIELARDGEAWTFVRPALPYPADPASVLPSVTKVTANRWARTSELADARAALAQPAVRGAVTAAGVTHAVAFSQKIEAGAHEGKRWGVVGDPTSARPFLVADYAATRFEATVDALRSKRLFGARSRDAVRSVRITLPGATEALVLESPDGQGEPALVGVPEGRAADDMQVRTVVATAAALMAKGFENARKASELGLVPGAATQVEVGFADGARLTILVSEQTDGTDPYATIDGGPLAGSVFTLNTYQVKNLQKRPEELLQP